MKKKSFLKVLMAVLSMLALTMGQTAKADEVEIGDGTSSDYRVPINPYYGYSLTQQIYTAEEIGMSGNITSVSFHYAGTNTFTMEGVQIYMKHVDKEYFTNSKDMVAVSASDLVFDGPFEFTGQGWITITLDTPFAYDGSSNLLLCCFDPTDGYFSSSDKFYYTATTNNMSVAYYSDGTKPDLDNITSYSGNNNLYQYRCNIKFVITPSGGVSVPTTFVASNITYNSATLTWGGSTGKYNVEVGKKGSGSWLRVANNVTTTTATITDGLQENTEYQARVQAVDLTDNTVVSGWRTISFATPEKVARPSGLMASNITYNSVQLNWTDNEENPDSWELAYSTSSSFSPDNVTPVEVTTKPFTLTGLSESTTYYAYIRTIKNGDASHWCDNKVSFTTPEKVARPSGLTASNVTYNSVQLNWTDNVENPSSWQLAYSTSSGFDPNSATPVDVTTKPFTLTGLSENTTYYAYIRTIKDGDASPWCDNKVSFSTPYRFAIPSNLKAMLTPGDGSIASLSWTENGTTTQWQLQYGTDASFASGTYTETTVSGTPSKSLTGLTPETTYYARVRSVYGEGESNWSSVITFTPTDNYVLTVHDGTTTNSQVPIYGNWVDSYLKCEFVIDAADLSLMAGGTIDAMTFYLSQSATASWGNANFQVFMKEVSATTISAFSGTDDATIVYEGALDGTQSTLTINFTTPYAYGGGNLLIGVYNTVTGTYKSCTFYGETVNGACVSGYSGNGLDAVGASQRNFLPKTTFEFTPVGGCTKPSNVSIGTLIYDDNTGTYRDTVIWVSDASAWNLRYKLKEAENWTSVAVTGSPFYILTGLSPAANYEVQVQADCGSGSPSNWTESVDISTPICTAENQGTISYKLIDSYGDGWNGAYIQVVHVNSGIVVAELAAESHGSSGESTDEGILNLCCGEDFDFVWVSGNYDEECSFYFYDELGDEIVSYVTDGSNGPTAGTLITYTMECVSCKKPTDLMLTAEPTTNSASLVWMRGSDDQTMWDLAYMADGDADYTLVEELTDTTYTLTGLQEDTKYTVKVRANCGGGDVSVWTEELTFRTSETYPKPTDVTTTDVAHTSAVARWTGNTAGKYDLRYRKVSGVASNFESGLSPWITIDADGDGYTWVWSSDYGNGVPGNGSNYCAVSESYHYDTSTPLNPDNYLVSPLVKLGGTLTFTACAQDASYPEEHFGIAISTTSRTDPSAFTTIKEWTMTASSSDPLNAPRRNGPRKIQGYWHPITVDLSAYAGQEGYVAFRHFDCTDWFYLDIDDVVLTEPGEGYAWTTVSDITEDSCYLAGLSMGTQYEVQVRSNYGSGHYSNWTPSTNFSTLDENTKFFLMDGNWDVASKWTPAGVPVAGNTVHIRAAATVPSGYDMPQMNVIVENGGSILVKDGAQFRSDSSVEITMEKHITGYGDGLANFYLLGSPVYYDNPSADDVENLLDGEYDLYSFDATEDLEWRNYEEDAFEMPKAGSGYLYASKDDNTLKFTGQTFATNSYKSTSFAYDDTSTDPFNGWALVSNIFPCNGWLLCTDESSNVVDGNFYKMNAAGGMLEMYQGAIALTPGEAAFVQLNQAGKIYFFPYEQAYRTPVYVGTVDGCPWLPEHELADHQDADALTGFNPGDVDMDGDVDSYDVPAMADALVGKWPNFTLETFDYDGDGVFSLKDLTKLVNYLKGK